ncbi:permease prefix domain 1-containing protein [Intestinibacter bartlettii]|uniref:permease prefix domain 1-containing protein n=1 Tax=Intestinibacter bartlettii TaxID=261299 RepID=UPI0022E046C7|nr:permease prefix domain 1-containing protein [Intestinibacter bartlettii]
MDLQKNSIDLFLQSVCRFVWDDEKARDIQDELKDHISSYIEEYMDDGMNIDDATNEALKQMGDPNVLSEFYKEKILPKRKWKLFLLGFACVLLIYSSIIMSQTKGFEIFFYVIALSITLFYVSMVYDFRETNKIRKSISEKEAVFFIRNQKKFCINNTNYKIGILVVILAIINLVFNIFSLNVPKAFALCYCFMPLIFILLNCSIGDNDISAVYEDEIFICDRFLYWNNIKGYRYSKQNFDNKEYNFLEIKVSEKAFGSKSILISISQMALIDEFFKSKNINKVRHF